MRLLLLPILGVACGVAVLAVAVGVAAWLIWRPWRPRRTDRELASMLVRYLRDEVARDELRKVTAETAWRWN